MISICESTSLPDPQSYHSNGGFVWWYLDLRDKAGNGLVLIWAFGLPFLPHYASQARKGNGRKPIDRPSLNISIYTEGSLDFYLLQEYAPEDCDSTVHQWRFGRSHIRFEQVFQKGILSVELNCPIPNTRDCLTGTIHFEGPLRHGTIGQSDPTHQWTPIIVAAEGEAHLSCGHSQYHIQGRGYHDRNAGTQPLHALDIDTWWWGRLAFPRHELIFYALFPKSTAPPLYLAIQVDSQGQTSRLTNPQVTFSAYRRSLYGMRWAQNISIEADQTSTIEIQLKHKIEDGPFYQRFMCDAHDADGDSFGFVEQIIPDKVDLDWMRPFVKMRVHHLEHPNSIWLPLFTGPRQDRIRRLFHWGDHK